MKRKLSHTLSSLESTYSHLIQTKNQTSDWKLDFPKSWLQGPNSKIKADSSEYLYTLESDELVIDP